VVPCTGREPIAENETIALTKQIKFMVFKKEHSQLALVGGRYDPELDATDGWTPPTLDQLRSVSRSESDIGFHRCIVRHVKDQLDLDLSDCKQWWKFVTICYDRGSYTDVTVIYLVSLWDVLPDREQFLSSWEQREYHRLDKIRNKEIAKLELEKAKKEKQKERTTSQSTGSNDPPKTELHKDSDTSSLLLPFQSSLSHSPPEQPPPNIISSKQTVPQGAEPLLKTSEEDQNPKESGLSKPSQMVEDKGGESTLDPKNILKEDNDVLSYPPPVSVDMRKAPKNIYVYTATKREKYKNLKSALISLDGLLEYDLEDDYEDTFEVSLFAENFNEMLQRDFGKNILNAVTRYARSLRQKEKKEKEEKAREAKAAQSKAEAEENKIQEEEADKKQQQPEEADKKRKREDEPELPGGDHPTDSTKKPKLNLESDLINESSPNLSPYSSGSPLATFQKEEFSSLDNLDLEQEPMSHLHPDEVENYTEEKELGEIDDNETIPDHQNPKEEYEENMDLIPPDESKEEASLKDPQTLQLESSKDESKMTSPKPELKKDLDLERAFHYFDRERGSYLKSEDLENLFHSLGQSFSKRYVRDLVSRVCEPAKVHSRRFYYRVLFEQANIPPSPANHE